jgi:hypothetical protein
MIHVSVDSNEAMRPRADLIRKAIDSDDNFKEIPAVEPMPFDLEFWSEDNIENAIHVELKDFSEAGNSDYLSSILNGHLWEQSLAARELGEPMIIAVLGDDRDVNEAIKTAASRNHRVDAKKLFQYFQMVDGFEANCIGLGIPVWRLKTDPWKRLLLRVRKILEGGDISGFAPKPSDGERQAVGLSILAGRGVGATKANNILQKFDLCLRPKIAIGCLEDCDGIGPKLASTIQKNIEVIE